MSKHVGHLEHTEFSRETTFPLDYADPTILRTDPLLLQGILLTLLHYFLTICFHPQVRLLDEMLTETARSHVHRYPAASRVIECLVNLPMVALCDLFDTKPGLPLAFVNSACCAFAFAYFFHRRRRRNSLR